MNKKLFYNILVIGFILYLISRISIKSIDNILLDYYKKIKNTICNIFNIENKSSTENIKDVTNNLSKDEKENTKKQ